MVQVSDGGTPVLSASNSLSITIVRPVAITTLALPNGATNTVYSATLTAAGGSSPYTWSKTSGSLPPGLTLSGDGVISGTPTTTGTFNFVVQVSDGGTPVLSASKSLSITIARLFAITTTSLSNGILNMAYTGTLTATSGTLPYTWSLAGGSLPSGLTLNATNGAITGTPTVSGFFSFTGRVTDAGNPAQTAIKPLSISVVMSIWSNTALPGTVDGGPDNAVELGVKFRSDMTGTVLGIRFYKASANTGTHVGNLWTSNGVPLATVTFSNETASGWQQALFATPMTIASNTVYVASYHANNGHYSADASYFQGKSANNPPLHALTNSTSNPNGFYVYGKIAFFQTQLGMPPTIGWMWYSCLDLPPLRQP